MNFRFDNFEFDVDRFTLQSPTGERIALQPLSLELLALLLRNEGRLVSKDEIQREVWGGLTVSPASLNAQIAKLRTALGDTNPPYRFIETVYGRGVRFAGTAERSAPAALVSPGPEPTAPQEPIAKDLLSNDLVGSKTRIAVMPFSLADEKDDLSGLASALPADIIISLSRLRLMSVTAQSSSFQFQSSSEGASNVKSILGADYWVGGSVARAGDNYLIYAELIDAETQAIVWADSFQEQPRDIHAIRSEIVDRIVSRVVTSVHDNEARRTHLIQPESMTAWQAYHSGVSLTYRRGRDHVTRARSCFQRAVRIDQSFARAWAGLANTFLFDIIGGNAEQRKASTRQMITSAENAIDADPNDASAVLFYGWSRQLIDGDEAPISWYEQALEIAPSYALAHRQLGSQFTFVGEGELAVKHTSAAILLDPQGPDRFGNYRDLAVSKFLVGDIAGALDWGCKAGEAPFDEIQILMAAVCANHLKGHTCEAERLASRMKNALPDMSWKDAYGTHILGDEHTQLFEGILSSYGVN
ncbi:MAG: winged helix-turn-helix domain-containing protein [Pseudomonadota bacterium]